MEAVTLQSYLYPDNTLWLKRSMAQNQLVNLLPINTTFIQGNRMRMGLRNSLRVKHDLSILDSDSPAFYRQQLRGISCADLVKEFCQLSKDATKSVVRIQLDALPTMLIGQDDWYTIIHYCVSCWNLSDFPAFALASPIINKSIDLFLLRETPLSWEVLKAEHQKVINQMMSLRLVLSVNTPVYRRIQANQWGISDRSTSLQYAVFVTWAIDQLLTEQKPETIHQLADQLWAYHQIESSYQHRDHNFSNLRFRFDKLPWLEPNELILGADDIWVWLNFNRLFKNTPIYQRVFCEQGVTRPSGKLNQVLLN